MTISKKFETITSFQGFNFKEWFGDMEYPEQSPVKLYGKELGKNMNYKEIIDKFNPGEVSIADIYNHLESASHECQMLFYVKDGDGVLRTVYVYWYDGGWHVYAYSVEHPIRWNAGYQVFSRNSFDTHTPKLLSPYE